MAYSMLHVYIMTDMLSRIIAQLKENHSAIPADTRNYLLSNQLKLANIQRDQWTDNTQGALEMIRYLGNEMSWKVWNNNLADIIELLKWLTGKDEEGGELGPLQKRYLGNLMNPILEKIGLEPATMYVTGDEKAMLRGTLMPYCATVEISACMPYASQLMAEWRLKPEVNPFYVANISYAIREELYCAAVIADGNNNSSFHFLLERLNHSENDSEPISKALACTKNANLLLELLLLNNTRLSSGPQYLQNAYFDIIPNEILSRRRLTMTQQVYEFWMRAAASGAVSPDAFMRYCWRLINQYAPPGLSDKILKFLEDHKTLFIGHYADNAAYFKDSINYNVDSCCTNDKDEAMTRQKIGDWFRENVI